MTDKAVGVPTARGSAAHIEASVPRVRAPRQRKSAASVAELLLKARPQLAGPFIGGGVGVAVLQYPQRPHGGAILSAIELLEEGNQRGGVFYRFIRAAGDVLEHEIMRRRLGFGRVGKRS